MAARVTIERILRDADDDSGQSIRDWKIEVDPGTITIRLRHGNGFVMLRSDDIDIFIADLERAKATAGTLI